ncbi:MAG TPA: MlaA family lipoprotein, partial [Candidatus Binatia bacterium]
MKFGFWHWIHRFSMAGALTLGLTLALLATTSVNAEEASQAIEGVGPAGEIAAPDQADSQETAGIALADVGAMAAATTTGEDFEDDPWESFNEKMFTFNREILDRYILKPVATA